LALSDSTAHGPDEYLMTIYLLAFPVGEYVPRRRGPQPTAPARIADQLGVSRASVGEMLKRLEAQGLVARGEKKEALLTSEGRATAMRIVRRHRLVERLLTDIMGYSGAEAHEKTDGLDDGFDEEMIERLYERLGQPERCPHGYPIDPDHELRENPTLKAVDRLLEGTGAEVVRVAEHDGPLLHWYYDNALVPGTAVTVGAGLPDGSVRLLLAGGREVVLDATQASGLFVRPAGVPVVPATSTCWADVLQHERRLVAGGE
jgi:DtxR family Mn-dependent transcriptional regulator